MSSQRLPASPKRAPQERKAGEASAPVTTWPQKHTSPFRPSGVGPVHSKREELGFILEGRISKGLWTYFKTITFFFFDMWPTEFSKKSENSFVIVS